MKPLSKKERLWTTVGVLCISGIATACSGAPWWMFPVFVVAGLAGCRESYFGMEES